MRSFLTFALLGTTVQVQGNNIPKPNPASEFCSFVRSVVTQEHEQSAATHFCSSYLHISAGTTSTTTVTPKTTITSTTTETTATFTLTPKTTASVTDTAAVTPTTTVTFTTTTTTTTETNALTQCGSFRPSKRRRDASPAPEVFSPWPWGNPLSSACQCLDIPSGTAVTSTKTARPSTATTVVVHKTASTVTSTVTLDKTTTITATASPVTSTVGAAATVTQTAIGPFQLGGSSISGQSGNRFASCPFPAGNSFDGDCSLERSSVMAGDHFILQPDGKLADITRGNNVLLAGNYARGNDYGNVMALQYPGGSESAFLTNCDLITTRADSGSCRLECQVTYEAQSFSTNNYCQTATDSNQWEFLAGTTSGCDVFTLYAYTLSAS